MSIRRGARAAFARQRHLARSPPGRRCTRRSTSSRDDRRLLRALFRYGGSPDHPLSWFGPATRAQRQQSIDFFAEALAGERLPEDVRDAAPVLPVDAAHGRSALFSV